MKKIALMVGVVTALVGAEAHAETDSDNFNPQITFRPNEFPWESGPIGPSALNVNLTASAYHEVDIEMTGTSEYDFDAQSLNFTGDEDGGVMQNALGIEVGVIVGIDFLGITGEFDFGLYNIEEEANGSFSPYLLPGDVERPLGVEEAIGPNDLIDQTVTIAGVPVTVDIDWVLNVPGITYRSNEIVLTDGEDSIIANEVGIYNAEDDNLDLMLPDAVPGETASMYGTLYGTFDAEVSLVFIINVSATISGVDFNIDQEVPLDYPVNENVPIEFPVERINFDVPELPDPGTSTGEAGDSSSGGDGDSSSGGDSDSDSDTTTGADPDPTTGGGDDGSSGGLPAAPSPSDSGCGCTTNEGGGMAWMLGLFGLVALRRRRD